MAKSCSTMNRYARGGIGFVVGGVVGGLVGGVVGVLTMGSVAKSQAENPGTHSTGAVLWTLLPVGVATIGAGVGTYIGARKPEC